MTALRCVKAGGIVVNPDGDVLMVLQPGGKWSFPKGHVDENEEVLDGAKREIHEESGVTELELSKVYAPYERTGNTTPASKHRFRVLYMFLFHTKQMELKPQDPDNTDAKWINKDDVVNYLSHERDREFYNEARKDF